MRLLHQRQVGGMQIRQAAATARAALRAEAAEVLGLPADELTTRDGAVIAANGKRVPYTELLADRTLEMKLDPKAPLKDPKDYRMKEDNIRCLYIEGSGCYGRNGHEDAAAAAVLLARELGKPVRMQWMRHDEHGWDPKGPPTLPD